MGITADFYMWHKSSLSKCASRVREYLRNKHLDRALRGDVFGGNLDTNPEQTTERLKTNEYSTEIKEAGIHPD